MMVLVDLMYLFSIYLFLDATKTGAHDIQPMSIPASRSRIKENEKEKDNWIKIDAITLIMYD